VIFKRVLTLITALACVVVWVLPGIVVPVRAADLSIEKPGIIDASLGMSDEELASFTAKSGAVAPFASCTYGYYTPTGYFCIKKGQLTPYYVSRGNDPSYSATFSGSDDLIFYSPIHSPIISDSFDTVFEVPVASFVSASSYNYTDVIFTYNVTFDIPSNCYHSIYMRVFYYDEGMSQIGQRTAILGNYTGPHTSTLTGSFEVVEGAAYYQTYVEIYLNPSVPDKTHTITFDNLTVSQWIRSLPDDDIPDESTEATEPSGDSGSSGSGSDSGSGGSSSFDDSGIIDSVTSSADKIITEIGADIDNQTQQITDSIAEQNGILEQGFGDLYDISDDIYNNIDVTNDKLDDMTEEVKSIPEKILDGIKGLFVPDEQDMQEYNDKWDELLHSRFGALYESVDIISEVGTVFVDTEARNTVDFPSVTIPLAGVDFEFGGWEVQVIPDGFDVLVDMLKGMISLLATVAFVNTLRNKFDRLMEGS